MFQVVRDREGDWLRQSFLSNYRPAPKQTIFIDNRRRYFRHVDYKFTDTSLGGNFPANNPPQFTRYADIRRSGRLSSSRQAFSSASGNNSNTSVTADQMHMIKPPPFDYGNGMGRYYSEAIDDNRILVYMAFGQPQFNSLTGFFTGFYNADASMMARRGRSNGLFFSLGKALGVITTLPIMPVLLGANAVKFLAQKPASKFSFLKESMPLYWTAVNTIVNSMAVNMGLIPRAFGEADLFAYDGDKSKIQPTQEFLNAYSAQYAEMFPGLFYKNGGIDIYNFMNRVNRIATKQYDEMYQQLTAGGDDPEAIIKNYFEKGTIEPQPMAHAQVAEMSDGSLNVISGLEGYLNSYLKSEMGSPITATKEGGGGGTGAVENMGRATASYNSDGSFFGKVEGYFKNLGDHLEAESQDGSRFICFGVDNFGTVGESFQSQTRETDLASRFNSSSSSARNTSISFAGGNIADGGVAALIEGAITSATDTLKGFAAGLQISGLFAYMGEAFVDIPKQWDSSSANFPTMSYSLQLRSPYGNKLALFQNLYVPLALLLAGALPLSSGTHAYNSPFCCSLFCKGAAQTRYGIIDQLNIRRGVGNVGWTDEGEPLGIDIDFTVVDLSSIMHMPIVANNPINPASGIFDEDSSFNDYMAVLSAMGLNDQVQPFRRLGLAVTRKMVSYRQYLSPAKLALHAVGSTIPGKIYNAVAVSQERP